MIGARQNPFHTLPCFRLRVWISGDISPSPTHELKKSEDICSWNFSRFVCWYNPSVVTNNFDERQGSRFFLNFFYFEGYWQLGGCTREFILPRHIVTGTKWKQIHQRLWYPIWQPVGLTISYVMKWLSTSL